MKLELKNLRNNVVIKDFTWISIGSIVNQLFQIALFITIINKFNVATIGNYNFILTLFTFFPILIFQGLNASVVQSVRRGYLGTFQRVLKIQFIYSVCLSFVIIVIIKSFNLVDMQMEQLLTTCLMLSPFAYGLTSWGSYLKGKLLFKKLAILEVLSNSPFIILAIIIIHFELIGLETVLIASFLNKALVNLIYVIWIKFKLPKHGAIEDGAINYGIKNSLFAFCNLVGNNIDKIIIYTILGPAQLGVFVIVEKIPEFLKGYIKLLREAIIPRLARESTIDEENKFLINKISIVINITLLTIIFALLPILFDKLFPGHLKQYLFHSQILTFSLIISNKNQLKFGIVLSKFDQLSLKYVTLWSNLTRVIFSIILIRNFDLWGAIISTIFYRLVMNYCINNRLKRYGARNFKP